MAKANEAKRWQAQHDPAALRPRLIDAVLKGKPLPQEPLEFG